MKNFFKLIRQYFNKTFHRKINLVFVCHRPAVWGALKTVFDNAIQDNSFNITIIAIPNKKQLPGRNFEHEVYESEGAEEFFKDYPCHVINGYNYQTKEWVNLKKIHPDYLFLQTPYDVCRPKLFKSSKIYKYTNICYMHYGVSMLKQSVISEFAKDFYQYTHLIFAETKYHKVHYEQEIKKHKKSFNVDNIKLTGFPAFDNLTQYKDQKSELWKHNGDFFKVLWTPRWTTGENNCHFEEYKDFLFNYCENKDIDFIFRPHPQAFLNYVSERLLSDTDIQHLKNKYANSKNCSLDNGKEYLKTIYSSDVLVTDASGMIFEYFLTEKPVIYCNKSTEWANDYSLKVLDAAYWVENQEELVHTLEMLKCGHDPLKERRLKMIHNLYYLPLKGAGYSIKELIKEDFYGGT